MGWVWNFSMTKTPGCWYLERTLPERASMAAFPLVLGAPGFAHWFRVAARNREIRLDLGILGSPLSKELNLH